MELSDRISALVDYSKLSIKGLSEKLGFKTPQLLYELIKGNTLTLSKKVQDSILNVYPEINKVWLLSGEGEMLANGSAPDSPAPDVRTPLIPLYNLDARGGYSENAELAAEFVDKMIPWENAREGDFAVTTSGTSMMPAILPGSLLLLRRVEGWREFLEFNILYVLELADERRLLKLVQKSAQPDALTLVSYNPANPPQEIPLSFVSRVYKVVAIRTHYGF